MSLLSRLKAAKESSGNEKASVASTDLLPLDIVEELLSAHPIVRHMRLGVREVHSALLSFHSQYIQLHVSGATEHPL